MEKVSCPYKKKNSGGSKRNFNLNPAQDFLHFRARVTSNVTELIIFRHSKFLSNSDRALCSGILLFVIQALYTRPDGCDSFSTKIISGKKIMNNLDAKLQASTVLDGSYRKKKEKEREGEGEGQGIAIYIRTILTSPGQ